MRTAILTALYLLLASAAAYASVELLGLAGVRSEMYLIVIGFALVGASAFTAMYSRWWGEKGGQWATIVLRNVLGIPLWISGFVIAWIEPSPVIFKPNLMIRLVGIILMIAGGWPFVVGHIELGWRTHMPSASDTLVRSGLYAFVRHPIYVGGFAILAGLALMRPRAPFVLACLLGIVWLVVQARLEEMDLLRRMPDYRDYMKHVPRFLPRLRRRAL